MAPDFETEITEISSQAYGEVLIPERLLRLTWEEMKLT
jgi:hypothetical protein